jgi:hypothetical protein
MVLFSCGAALHAMPGPSAVDLKADKPGSLRFFGAEAADLFTKEVDASYRGVLRKSYFAESAGGYPAGFVRASPPGQGWAETFWTRDGGTFMRELTLWGNFEHAALTADCLINLVTRNADGFYSFPEYFKGDTPGSGTELDGTSSIIIGMVMLWQRLPEHNPHKQRIYEFLHQPASPVAYLHKRLEVGPLVAGSGEFGGGCNIEGEFYNVVQNNLTALALLAAAKMEAEAGDQGLADTYQADARKIRDGMEKYLVDANGVWIWCVSPKTLQPDAAVVNHEINRGFGGLNGVACMYADVLGLEPLASTWKGIAHSLRTFDKLYAFPHRKAQFDRYGFWSQFDVFRGGVSSGTAYGEGYAVQTMLLYDKLDMAEKSLTWIATSTHRPVPGYRIDRDSLYYFCERSYSPEAVGKIELEQGCGALNLVSVSEPLKAARLVLGVDDTSLDEVRILPRVPKSWRGVEALNWPIRTSNGIVRADIKFEQTAGSNTFTLSLPAGQTIPRLAVRLPVNGGKWEWQRQSNVTRVEMSSGK